MASILGLEFAFGKNLRSSAARLRKWVCGGCFGVDSYPLVGAGRPAEPFASCPVPSIGKHSVSSLTQSLQVRQVGVTVIGVSLIKLGAPRVEWPSAFWSFLIHGLARSHWQSWSAQFLWDLHPHCTLWVRSIALSVTVGMQHRCSLYPW